AHVERRGSSFMIPPGAYESCLHHIPSDFTALSYLAGAVATAPHGDVTISDFVPSKMSSELDFFRALADLGIRTEYDAGRHSLRIFLAAPTASTVDIDARNIPTVVPTLAAIAPFVDARVRLRNAAHVNNHKCRRVEIML